MASARKSIPSAVSSQAVVQSHAESNRELAEAFERYLVSRGFSPPTLRAYMDSVNRYVEMLGSMSVVDAERREIREFQAGLLKRGLSSNSLRLHTIALRGFHKFIRLSGLTKHDPTLLLSPRKLPGRIPRFLTLKEVDKLLAACETPFERAVIEVMYSTGVRISELVSIRVEDITFSSPGVIRIIRGKGNKDRIVLFGSKADAAIREYLGDRRTGFLFEAPARIGELIKSRWRKCSWYGRYYDNGVQREVRLGKVADMSEAEAREKLDQFLSADAGIYRASGKALRQPLNSPCPRAHSPPREGFGRPSALFAASVCDSSPRRRRRSSGGSRAARPRQPHDDDALHPLFQ